VDVFVREAQIDDAEAIINLLNPIIQAGVYTVLTTPFSIEAEQAFILNFPKQGIFHVAVCRDEQKVVGCQNVEPFATYTSAFAHVGVIGTFVDLSSRRQGVGKSLFKATFEVARDKGYEKLFSFVRADNAAALATYLSQGFYSIGTAQRHAKINGIYIDEIMIERFL
jgi:L-amino acid N-acyltransferase YncA